MGELNFFNLSDLKEKYNLEYFVETGSFRGDGIKYASKFDFKKIYSIELLEEYYNYCRRMFSDNKKIEIHLGKSVNVLEFLLKNNDIGRTLFWLDAHVPNHYNNNYSKDYVNEKDLVIPLEDELRAIVSNKNVSEDVFILDDLRIYEKGNYERGSWNTVIDLGLGGIEFIYEMLDTTHNIEKIYKHEGFILCTPKI